MYKNKVLKNKDKKSNLKRDKINIKFIFIFYYIIIRKINKKLIYREY